MRSRRVFRVSKKVREFAARLQPGGPEEYRALAAYSLVSWRIRPAADFHVTLYKEQWLKRLEMADDSRAFIAANEAQLKTKQSK
jgi:hypothetical protein